VLFVFLVYFQLSLRDKVPHTSDAVVLAETGLIFVVGLILEDFRVCWQHVFQYNLVEHTGMILCLTISLTFLVIGSIAASALSFSHFNVINNKFNFTRPL
jgi:hypothetical protein